MGQPGEGDRKAKNEWKDLQEEVNGTPLFAVWLPCHLKLSQAISALQIRVCRCLTYEIKLQVSTLLKWITIELYLIREEESEVCWII